MQKPTLGIVTTWFERGATRVSMALMEVLKEKYNLRIYARGGDEFPHKDPKWNKDFVHWGEFVPGARNTFIDFNDFSKWIEREQISLLLFNEQQSWDVILKLKKRTQIPIGAYVDYYTDATVNCFGLYDFLICNTKRHYSVFKHHPNALYVPWGVTEFATQPPPSGSNVRFFHNLGFNPQRKGTDLILRAFKQLTDARISLILHAQKPLADFPDLQEMVAADHRVTWINKDAPPPGLYHLGDVYVYPSRLEGIGLSLPEALSQGLPAITTDEAPMNEFVVHGQNGFLVEVERHWKRGDNYYWNMAEVNVNALAQAMQSYILLPEELTKRKETTLAIAKERLNWKKNASSLSELLAKVRWTAPKETTWSYTQSLEEKETPHVTIKQRTHRILIALGARNLKRKLFGRE
jgi:1,2-diacylglycerol 3-alpha-glucosyltransferase